jgi:hypothetical protein
MDEREQASPKTDAPATTEFNSRGLGDVVNQYSRLLLLLQFILPELMHGPTDAGIPRVHASAAWSATAQGIAPQVPQQQPDAW